ncbi:hypothetical protein QOT17_003469 [Balamuthia mandrillaris]
MTAVPLAAMGWAHKVWRGYTSHLVERPFLTNALTSAVINSIGDALAQSLERRGRRLQEEQEGVRQKEEVRWHPARTVSMFFFGLGISGPFSFMWFRFLERTYGSAKSLSVVAKKVLTNQLFFAPTINTAAMSYCTIWKVFLAPSDESSSQISMAKTKDAVVEKLKKDFIPTWVNSTKVWPLAQSINFYFVPFQYRVLYMGLVATGWSAYLSTVGYRKEAAPSVATVPPSPVPSLASLNTTA